MYPFGSSYQLLVTWWKVLIGFFIMHYTAGLILSIVFQLAHVVEETENPTPNELGRWVILGQFINYLQPNFAQKIK
jgi:hypothetical protein